MDISMWDISERQWPFAGSQQQKLQFLLGYAILAPSGHNTQPWLFQLNSRSLLLFADKRRSLRVIDPQDRELVISCGCALYYLHIAARKFGHELNINLFPDPTQKDLLASISLQDGQKPLPMEMRLFNAIRQRRTYRLPFEPLTPNKSTVSQIIEDGQQFGCHAQQLRNEYDYGVMADIVDKGDRSQAGNQACRKELSQWVRANNSSENDGMPGHAFGIGNLASRMGPFYLRRFNWGKFQSSKDQQLILQAPVLMVLSTAKDKPQDWLMAGQAVANMLLRATVAGLSASFFNQTIEEPRLRQELSTRLRVNGYPQMVMRFGFADTQNASPTPRRSVKEVLSGSCGI